MLLTLTSTDPKSFLFAAHEQSPGHRWWFASFGQVSKTDFEARHWSVRMAAATISAKLTGGPRGGISLGIILR